MPRTTRLLRCAAARSVLASLLVATALSAATPATAAVRVPAGYRVATFASGLLHPTAIARRAGGTIWVTTEPGSVYRIPAGGGTAVRFATGLRQSTLGLVWAGDDLFVSQRGGVVRLRDANRDGLADGPAVPIVRNLPNKLHQQDNLALGRDGRLYLGIGTTCDFCTEKDPRSGTVISFRRDGSHGKIVARGLRNPYGLAFDAAGRLWVADEGRDEPEGPPEELNRIDLRKPVRNFGWPSCWGKGGGSGCAGTIAPIAVYEAHSAVTGLAVQTVGGGTTIFMAHWGTYFGRVHGRYVTRTRVAGGKVVVTRFATGLEHPIDVKLLPDGSLLVADFGTLSATAKTGRIYRISRA